jgi:hypothetical protein
VLIAAVVWHRNSVVNKQQLFVINHLLDQAPHPPPPSPQRALPLPPPHDDQERAPAPRNNHVYDVVAEQTTTVATTAFPSNRNGAESAYVKADPLQPALYDTRRSARSAAHAAIGTVHSVQTLKANGKLDIVHADVYGLVGRSGAGQADYFAYGRAVKMVGGVIASNSVSAIPTEGEEEGGLEATSSRTRPAPAANSDTRTPLLTPKQTYVGSSLAYGDAFVHSYASANDALDAHMPTPIRRTASDEYVESIEAVGRSAAAAAPRLTVPESDAVHRLLSTASTTAHGFSEPSFQDGYLTHVSDSGVVRLVSDPSRLTTRSVASPCTTASSTHSLDAPAQPNHIASASPAFRRVLGSVRQTNQMFTLRNSSDGVGPVERHTSDV